LATSRSFGDKHFKFDSDKPPVIGKCIYHNYSFTVLTNFYPYSAIPNVDEIKIDEEMKLILIGSDG
jgi:serine/threonine protein phosphatase PrpC